MFPKIRFPDYAKEPEGPTGPESAKSLKESNKLNFAREETSNTTLTRNDLGHLGNIAEISCERRIGRNISLGVSVVGRGYGGGSCSTKDLAPVKTEYGSFGLGMRRFESPVPMKLTLGDLKPESETTSAKLRMKVLPDKRREEDEPCF